MLMTNYLNPGSSQLTVALHQHAAKFVVEVAKNALYHGIFGIHVIIVVIHTVFITFQGNL